MSKVQIKFKQPRTPGYDIHIQPGLLADSGRVLKPRFKGGSAFIISSPRVWKLWGSTFKRGLAGGGFKNPGLHLVPDGEKNKTFAQVERALKALARFGKASDTNPFVVLLGGGVIGDLGGFVAASYKRGLPFVQVPTTLLSMVDSSVGGKLGVDFDTPQGLIKNLVGAFYQPEVVLIDPKVLKTLAPRDFRSGMGEVVKTAVLFDAAMFVRLERNVDRILKVEPALLANIVRDCVGHKARVVMKDEFDRKGVRALLNLGHTFGHAVEAASGFKLLHGEAVAFGMACACDLSRVLKISTASQVSNFERIEILLLNLGFETRLKGISLVKTLRAMSQDKKFEGGMKFVLPLRLGKSELLSVRREEAVQAVLKSRLT